MNCAGMLRVIEFSNGGKTVYADVVAAPSDLREQAAEEVMGDIDVDAHEPGDVVGQITFYDVMGDPSYEYELNDVAVRA